MTTEAPEVPPAPEIRSLVASDADALHAFFGTTDAADRTFFWADVTDPEVARGWAQDERRLRRCAVEADGSISAFGALLGGTDFTSHVAEMVLVVGPQARRRGIGSALAKLLLLDAVQHDYLKVTIQIASDSTAAIEMFQRIGFEGEALLRDHLRSPVDGQLRDLVVLAHLVDEQWSGIVSAGLDEQLA